MKMTPTTVGDDMVVSLHYTLHLGDGELVDRSDEDAPLEFIQGRGHVIGGLEEGLYGMAVGERKTIVVAPEDGYGQYDPEAYELVPLSVFPDDLELELGLGVEVYDEESDETLPAYIAEIRADDVLLDFNHPMAGETLHFDVKVVGLRSATHEELYHDHVHGPDDRH